MYRLTVTFSQGRNLIAADKGGTSDPYIKASIVREGKSKGEQEFKTKVIKKTLNPNWGETTTFINVTPRDTLSIKCYDHDRVGSHDPLGNAKLPVQTLIDLFCSGTNSKWFPLEKGDKGEVLIQFEFDPHPASAAKLTTPAVPERKKSDSKIKKGKSSSSDGQDYIQFTVTISNVKCRNLLAKDSNGTSDPYVKFDFDGTTIRTETIMKNLNPDFTFSKEFKYNSKCQYPFQLYAKTLKIEVYDKDLTDKDDLIGVVKIPILNLAAGPAHHVHELYDRTRLAGSIAFDIEMVQESGQPVPKTKSGVQVDGNKVIPLKGEALSPLLSNAGSTWGDYLHNHHVGEMLLNKINSITNETTLGNVLALLSRLHVAIHDHSTIKALKEQSKNAVLPWNTFYIWSILAFNADNATNADRIIGDKKFYVDDVLDYVNAHPTDAFLPACAANLIAAPNKFVPIIPKLLEFLQNDLAIDTVVIALARVVIEVQEAATSFIENRGPEIICNLLKKHISNSLVTQAIMNALIMWANAKLIISYEPFIEPVVVAAQGNARDTGFLRVMFDFFTALISAGLVAETALASVKAQILPTLQENLSDPRVVASVLAFASWQTTLADTKELLSATFAALRGFLKPILLTDAEIKSHSDTPSDVIKRFNEEEANFNAVCRFAADVLARLILIQDDLHKRIVKHLSEEEYALSSYLLRNMSIEFLPGLKPDLCLAIIEANPSHSAKAYAKISGALNLRPWAVMPLPVLERIIQNLDTQLAGADTIPTYLVDVVSSLSAVSYHPNFYQFTNWQKLGPRIENALNAMGRQTPVPYASVGILLSGILPALLFASNCYMCFTPAVIPTFASMLAPQNIAKAQPEEAAVIVRFLAFLCYNPQILSAFKDQQNLMINVTALTNKFDSTALVAAYLELLICFAGSDELKTYLLDEDAAALASRLLKTYIDVPEVFEAGVRFFNAFASQ